MVINKDIVQTNNLIQEFVSQHGLEIPTDLIKLLSNLDWIIRKEVTQNLVELRGNPTKRI